MRIFLEQPLDLSTTLQSGQAFRWRYYGGWFHGVVTGNIVKIRQYLEEIEVITTPDDATSISQAMWDYLGMSTDLENVYNSIGTESRIRGAIKIHRGMRILRQDPWECLVSFICTSNSNIPRITKNIESICSSLGTPIGVGNDVRNMFPTPEQLASAGEERLRMLGLGYRAPYLVCTARTVADGLLDLESLRNVPYEEALSVLTGLPGVGDKVANCVLLFSLDKLQAFPVDVWIRRVLQEWYLGDEKIVSNKSMRLWAQDYFGSYAGYANHYLFHSRRIQG